MTAERICLIVPTIRGPEFLRHYFLNARNHGFSLSRIETLLVTERTFDREKALKLFESENVSGQVFAPIDRSRWFEDHGIEMYEDLIPKHSHAETSFGLLYMLAHPEYNYGFFVDDDTIPLPSQDFFGEHILNLGFRGSIDVVSSDKHWVNVLYQQFSRHFLYPRGYPYAAVGERIRVERQFVGDVVCSQGLWTNVPDLDAIRILTQGGLDGRSETRLTEADFTGNFVVAPRNYLTVSSMNLAFRREVIPAFYQLPMDDNAWGIGRFDDIWSGVFLKRVCDAQGKSMLSGRPLCQHNKGRRNVFKDLLSEAKALELNEHLWRLADEVPVAGGWREQYRNLAAALANASKGVSSDQRGFLAYCAKAMMRWTECCEILSDQT